MITKFRVFAALAVASIALVGCSSEAEKSSKSLQDYTPDTTLPMSQQVADSGVATMPYEVDEEDWKNATMEFCHIMLKIDDYPEYEDADDVMVDEGLDELWDREERATIARIMSANHCPNRIIE